MEDDLPIKMKKTGNEITFMIEGVIDLSNVRLFKPKILENVSDEVTNVIVDISELKYIDSSGICMLIVIKNQLHNAKKTFAIKSNKTTLKKLFSSGVVEKLFTIIE